MDPPHVIEVSDIFWDTIARIVAMADVADETPKDESSCIDGIYCVEVSLSFSAHLQQAVDRDMYTWCPMLTEDAIALPPAFFHRRRGYFRGHSCRDVEVTMAAAEQIEYVYMDAMSMVDDILEMYEEAASWMQESLTQRRRRRDLKIVRDLDKARDLSIFTVLI